MVRLSKILWRVNAFEVPIEAKPKSCEDSHGCGQLIVLKLGNFIEDRLYFVECFCKAEQLASVASAF